MGKSIDDFINPKGRIPRVYPWMNVNSPEGRRARLEMWKGATGLPVAFPHCNGTHNYIKKDYI
ncbi:hypothetical protein CVT91_05045 [Candidatus Atribacteria bacterium HGW-Atribacteria-1]|nr:MAG: hypothetical protein CVT91_05045 [Candidatus Atribacteria bacterium HGW-Atribacteria-1]